MTRSRTLLLFAILAGTLSAAHAPAAQGSSGGPASGATARLASPPNQPAPPAPRGAAAAQPERVYTIDTSGAPARGPRTAAVTIVEFSDYQ